jgi:glycosyltransferase involved in cell wall biosynthesis
MAQYVLITPVKDEETNLPRLAQCIKNQTILPQIWVIADDASLDNTVQIIQRLEHQSSWIKGIQFTLTSTRAFGKKFGRLCNFAFTHALQQSEKTRASIDFLVKADADMIFPPNCIERLLAKFSEDRTLGIASPYLEEVTSDFLHNHPLWYKEPTFLQTTSFYDLALEPSDGLRVYRRRAFEEIGQIPETQTADTVAVVKARLRKWKAIQFKDIIALTVRETGSSVGKRFWRKGNNLYYLDYHPALLLLNAIWLTFKEITAIPSLIAGYLYGVINRQNKIDDHEVRTYFKYTRVNEIVSYILRRSPL